MKLACFSSCIRSLVNESKMTYPEAAAYAASIGITGVEFGSSEVKRDDFAQTVSDLRDNGIGVCCIHHSDHLGAKDDVAFSSALRRCFGVIDDAVALECPFVMFLPVQLDDLEDLDDRPRALERSIEGLTYLSSYAHGKGVTVIIENISQYLLPFSTAEDLEALATKVPYLKLNYDVGNFRWVALDVLKCYEKLKPYFAFSHIKDYKYGESGARPALDGKYLVDAYHGQGVLPMEEILRRLQSDGYKGWYVIEQGMPEMKDKLAVSAALIARYQAE